MGAREPVSGGARLSADEVRQVARLARVAISGEEVERCRDQLSAVLAYVDRLGEVDVRGPDGRLIDPLVHVGDATNRLADDTPGATLATESLMRMAPDTMPPFVRVPRVLGVGGGA